MKENLQLTDEAATSAITSFLNGLNLEKTDEVTASLIRRRILKITEDLPQMEPK